MKTMAKLVEQFNKKSTKKLELVDFGVTKPGYYTLAVKCCQMPSFFIYFKSCNEFRESSCILLELWK